jgi:hypothetical protein
MSSYYPSSYLISFYSYLSYFLYRLPLLLPIRGLSLSLSTYLYVGCLSYVQHGLSLFSFVYVLIFLSIRTGAIPPTYFLYVLSFSLFVRGLSLPLIFYMYLSFSLFVRGLSLLLTFYMYLSFSLFVRGLSLLLTFYMYCLSLYSYGGYSSYLFSTWAVHSVYVATVEFILGYILEMKSLT